MLLSEEDRNMVYVEYRGKVMRYISGRIPNPQDAEDLVSCVFMKVYRKPDAFDESRALLSTWIYFVTKNTVVGYYRIRKTFSELPEDIEQDGSVDERLINNETPERLALAPERLDSRSRDIVILHYYEGLTLKEIAEKCRCRTPAPR